MARTDANSGGEPLGSPSTGDLWGAVEPCWRNIGFRGQVPVVMEVTLDGRGALRRPPTVIRNASATLSEVRLRSESNALAAVAACLPRGRVRVAASHHRLELPAPP